MKSSEYSFNFLHFCSWLDDKTQKIKNYLKYLESGEYVQINYNSLWSSLNCMQCLARFFMLRAIDFFFQIKMRCCKMNKNAHKWYVCEMYRNIHERSHKIRHNEMVNRLIYALSAICLSDIKIIWINLHTTKQHFMIFSIDTIHSSRTEVTKNTIPNYLNNNHLIFTIRLSVLFCVNKYFELIKWHLFFANR